MELGDSRDLSKEELIYLKKSLISLEKYDFLKEGFSIESQGDYISIVNLQDEEIKGSICFEDVKKVVTLVSDFILPLNSITVNTDIKGIVKGSIWVASDKRRVKEYDVSLWGGEQ